MADPVYLDENGNPIQAQAAAGPKVYLDENGEPQHSKQDTSAYEPLSDRPDTAGAATSFSQTSGVDPDRGFVNTLKDWGTGIKHAVTHPIDSAEMIGGALDEGQRQEFQKAFEQKDRGNYGNAAAHLFYGYTPVVGPALGRAATQGEQRNYAGMLGTTGAVALPLVTGSPEARANLGSALRRPIDAIKPAMAKTSERLYQSALKPSTRLGIDGMKELSRTGLKEEIPVNAKGLEKAGNLREELDNQIKASIDSGSNKGATVDPKAVASRLAPLRARLAVQVNPEADLAAVGNVKDEFLRNNKEPIPASDAQAIKQGTYRALRGSYGQMTDAARESQKALARGIKEELADQFPELNDLNARDGKLIQFEPALEKAVARQGNHQMIGIGTPAVGAAAKAVTGNTGVAGLAAAVKMAVDDPVIKSKLAIAIYRGSKGRLTLPQATARVSSYAATLGAVPGGTRNAEAPPVQ